MKEKIFFGLKNIFNRDSKDLHRKLLVFSIFVIISATFWLLNALTKEYSTFIEYPVKFRNTPEDKVLVGELPESIHMYVKGYGFSLVQYQVNPLQKPYSFDFDDYKMRGFGDDRPYDYYILTKSAERDIEKGLLSDVQIINIYPDTLYFSFAPVTSKKVPIVADLNVTLDKQFILSDKIEIIPDSIIINGPQSILDTINRVETSSFSYTELSETIKRNIGLKRIDNIKYSKTRIILNIPVEKFTENNISVPISIVNLPDSIDIEIFPASIDLKYKAGLSKFDNIKIDDFKVVADYEDIKSSLGSKIKVRLIRYPSITYDIDYHPKSVDYILKK